MGTVANPGRVVYLDFETYFDKTYSLRKMSVPEYVKNPNFEILLVSYAVADQPVQTAVGSREELSLLLAAVITGDCTVVAHNACFEGFICEQYLGLRPKGYFCTMMGSRPYVAPFTGSMSAEAVTKFFGGPAKLTMPPIYGKTRAQLCESLTGIADLSTYCANDVEIARHAYKEITARMPEDEQELVNLHVLKFVRPKVRVDTAMLYDMVEDIMTDKAKLLLTLPRGCTAADLTSNPKFAAALERFGARVPTKTSPITGKPTYALAKKDPGFLDLLNNGTPDVRSLCNARLGYRSSILETRAESLGAIARACGGWLPIPLLYYGAHTGRAAGWQGINMQNLPKKGGIRRALIAPAGCSYVVADLSQIEARIVATLAGQWDLVQEFSGDPYSSFATFIYKIPVSKADPATKTERFVGKTCILGLGYGMSAAKLQATLAGAEEPVDLDAFECARIVKAYRNKYRCIPNLWRMMDKQIRNMAGLVNGTTTFGPLEFGQGYMGLPNGMRINYPGLHYSNGGYTYKFHGRGNAGYDKGLWGGSVTENAVQALARIVISRAELRLARLGLLAALQVHDELVYIVRDEAVEAVKKAVSMALCDPVPWLPGLPLACEVASGKSYGQAK